MKKAVYSLLLVILHIAAVPCASQAQVPSSISRLATLAKVWGFLKYYHPSAAMGKPDWDQELVRMIPLAEQASTQHAFDSLLEAWYHSLPVAGLSAKPVNWKADSLVRIFTENDIQQFTVSRQLKKELLLLYQYHLPGRSRYITRHVEEHYLDHIYHTEDLHESPSYPDRPMRLLALFRYWNTINYFYPHKNRIRDWDNVLTSYIPLFSQVADSLQYRFAVKELIHELPDAHSFLNEQTRIYYYIPFRVDYIDGKYLIGQCNDSMAKKGDYRLGDEITAINGLSTAEREQRLLKTITGTNSISLHRNIAEELLRVGDSVLPVSFKRNGQSITKTVELHTWEVYQHLPRPPAKPLWRELENGIWYVRFCRITNPDTVRYLFRDISQAKAVIWEMRDYPNYQVTTQLAKYLFPGKTQITEERNASDSFPGTFIKSSYNFIPDTVSTEIFNKPMIVLVDEHSQSLSESIAAMLKIRPHTIIIGRQTAGTTGNITWFSLPGGMEVSYTGVGVTGVQNSFVQGEGVKLDVPITLTQQKIMQSKDYILEQALIYARKYH